MDKQNKESKDENKKAKYTLEELVKGITEENKHEEIITDTQGNELI